MGRLTLNVLLSFAQFEREVTAERIRDKIAASKRRGMWMGGVVPLGYDVVGRELVVNSKEARTVRAIFELYAEHASVARVKQEADRLGLRTKPRMAKNGSRRGDQPFTRGHIYKLLANPIYIGEIAHKAERFVGRHEAIIDRALWEAVAEQLKRNAVRRAGSTNTKTQSLLTGMLFDADGARMVPSHCRKNGRRYRYYCCRVSTGSRADGSVLRLPAGEIEKVVIEGICAWLRDRHRLIEHLHLSASGPSHLRGTIKKAAQLSKQLASATAPEQREMLTPILERIEVGAERVSIRFRSGVLIGMLSEGANDKRTDAGSSPSDPIVRIGLPISFKRRGVQTKLVLTGKSAARLNRDPKLIAAVVRRQAWFADLREGKAVSVGELARSERVDRADLGRMMRLAFLAPDIVEAILAGSQPTGLTVSRLKRLSDLPLSWSDQRRLLGFTS